jgi:hypothetical protein
MMKQMIISLFIALGYFSHAAAQVTSFNASLCVAGSGVTALPNCGFLNEQQTNCNTNLPKADQIKCWCNQKQFNAIIEYVLKSCLFIPSPVLSVLVSLLVDVEMKCDSASAMASGTTRCKIQLVTGTMAAIGISASP